MMVWFVIAIIFLFITVIVLITPSTSKEEESRRKELRNRLRWQHEVYGVEFRVTGDLWGRGMEKHSRNQTKEHRENYIRDQKAGSFQRSYDEWIKGKRP